MKIYDDQYIVVTGGAGFIGSGVIRALNDLGHSNIIVVDELGKDERWKNLRLKSFADVLDKSELFQWLDGKESAIEAFIHLGATTDTLETDASHLLENNYRFSQKLCDYAITNGHRFIYASSAATYGDGSLGFSDDHEQIETLEPLNMYGYSKHLFDLWVKQQGLLDKVVGLKYFNVFGPNESHKGRMASAITNFLPQILSTGKVKLFESYHDDYENGEQKRDFIYVKDAARMTCSFLENDQTGIYNIGTGNAGTWKELAEGVFEALGKKSSIEFIPMPEGLKENYQYFTCADMKKVSKALGEKAETAPLKENVVDYVQNYLVKGKRW